MKVLIAAPLRQDPKIFTEYQKGLDSLIIPDGVEVDRYFVVNDCDEVIPYIRGAKMRWNIRITCGRANWSARCRSIGT